MRVFFLLTLLGRARGFVVEAKAAGSCGAFPRRGYGEGNCTCFAVSGVDNADAMRVQFKNTTYEVAAAAACVWAVGDTVMISVRSGGSWSSPVRVALYGHSVTDPMGLLSPPLSQPSPHKILPLRPWRQRIIRFRDAHSPIDQACLVVQLSALAAVASVAVRTIVSARKKINALRKAE
jgi:hypothetical protein